MVTMMTASGPAASRPYMPGYGIQPAASGLMSWDDAERVLTASTDYWIATNRPDAPPHLMPVWGVWLGGALWFSSGGRSRKVRNLVADAHCTAATDDSANPVVLSGIATIVVDRDEIAAFAAASNAKYEGDYYTEDFLDPAVNATVRLRPEWAFALRHDDFAGSPTRWTFPPTVGS